MFRDTLTTIPPIPIPLITTFLLIIPAIVLITFLIIIPLTSAFTTTIVPVNSTFATIYIHDAVDIYAYEVALDFTGEIVNVTHSDFLRVEGDLPDSTVYGHNVKDNVLYAYGSRLDSTRKGVNGSGELFNITYTKNPTQQLSYNVNQDFAGEDLSLISEPDETDSYDGVSRKAIFIGILGLITVWLVRRLTR